MPIYFIQCQRRTTVVVGDKVVALLQFRNSLLQLQNEYALALNLLLQLLICLREEPHSLVRRVTNVLPAHVLLVQLQVFVLRLRQTPLQLVHALLVLLDLRVRRR